MTRNNADFGCLAVLHLWEGAVSLNALRVGAWRVWLHEHRVGTKPTPTLNMG